MLSTTNPPVAAAAERGQPIARRRLLQGIAAAAAIAPVAPILAACGGSSSSSTKTNEKVQLSIMWWGAEARAATTKKVLDLYTAKHSNVTFTTTWQGNSGYYDKLATQAAGGNAPDIFQIDDNALSEYAERNIALDLSSYVDSKKIDISKFPDSLAKYGQVNGKTMGVALGENTFGLIYNKTLVTNLGVAEPTIGMTWEQLIAWAGEITTKTQGKVFGTMDPSADYKALWAWLRPQGKQLYNGKQLGFTVEDLTKWFDLWKGARDSKAAPTADLIHVANGGDVTKQLVVTGKAATSFLWANQLPDLSKSTKDTLAVVSYPGDPAAAWARASMYFSGYRGTKHKDVVADVINFFVNDPDAAKAMGTDRGLTSNLDLRKVVDDSLTDTNMKASVAFEAQITPKFGPAPAPPPKGHAKIKTQLVTSAESVQFGKATASAAAQDFVTQANNALSS